MWELLRRGNARRQIYSVPQVQHCRADVYRTPPLKPRLRALRLSIGVAFRPSKGSSASDGGLGSGLIRGLRYPTKAWLRITFRQPKARPQRTAGHAERNSALAALQDQYNRGRDTAHTARANPTAMPGLFRDINRSSRAEDSKAESRKHIGRDDVMSRIGLSPVLRLAGMSLVVGVFRQPTAATAMPIRILGLLPVLVRTGPYRPSAAARLSEAGDIHSGPNCPLTTASRLIETVAQNFGLALSYGERGQS